MVVSWISMDKIPTNGSCFAPPKQAITPGNFSGSSPPTPFPYPLKPGCLLAGSEVRFAAAAETTGTMRTATNGTLLFADHDVDADDSPTTVSTPRAVHVVRLDGLDPATR